MRLFSLIALVLAAACGGPRKPGTAPNVTYFWRLTSSEVAFNDMCTDYEPYRKAHPAVKVQESEDKNNNGQLDPGEDTNGNMRLDGATYIVYKGSEDAKKATLMRCEFLDPSKCVPSPENVVF